MSAKEIAKKSFYLNVGKTLRATVEFKTTSEDKSNTIKVEMLQHDDSGRRKNLYRVCSPKKSLGTGLFVINNIHKDNQLWVQMPKEKSPKALRSTKRYQPFINTEFSFDDLSKFNLGHNKFSRLKDDDKHYVIEVTPKLKGSNYKRKQLWIRKDNYMVQKAEYYDNKNDLFKKLVVNIIKKTEGFWTVEQMRMDNIKTKSSTTVTYKDISYNTKIDFTLFDHKKITTKCSI